MIIVHKRAIFAAKRQKELKLREKIEKKKKTKKIKIFGVFAFVKCKINFRVIEQLNFVSGKASGKLFAMTSDCFYQLSVCEFSGVIVIYHDKTLSDVSKIYCMCKSLKSLENHQRMFHHPF